MALIAPMQRTVRICSGRHRAACLSRHGDALRLRYPPPQESLRSESRARKKSPEEFRFELISSLRFTRPQHAFSART